MRYGVNRQFLMFMAGVVWILAGVNILCIGIMTWINISSFQLFRVCEAIVVFLLFFNFVFKKLFYKHTS